MQFRIVEEEEDGGDVPAAVRRGIREADPPDVGARDWQPLCLSLRDADGAIVGGVYGATMWGWLMIDGLWVAPELRGQGHGGRLLDRAEALAVARGCRGVWLGTFDFQARTFYERRGYEVFARLPGFPGGHAHFHLSKRLGDAADADAVADPRRTRAELRSLTDDEYFWRLMMPAWDDASRGTPGQRLLAVTTTLVRDVENGGLHQALWNRTHDAVAEVVAALERLGALDHAAAVRTASELLLGDHAPTDLGARRSLLGARASEEMIARLEPLDRRLYDERRLWPYYRRYVAAHPAEFFRD
jgi:GNAT superfamily N-acetyltransferase